MYKKYFGTTLFISKSVETDDFSKKFVNDWLSFSKKFKLHPIKSLMDCHLQIIFLDILAILSKISVNSVFCLLQEFIKKHKKIFYIWRGVVKKILFYVEEEQDEMSNSNFNDSDSKTNIKLFIFVLKLLV